MGNGHAKAERHFQFYKRCTEAFTRSGPCNPAFGGLEDELTALGLIDAAAFFGEIKPRGRILLDAGGKPWGVRPQFEVTGFVKAALEDRRHYVESLVTLRKGEAPDISEWSKWAASLRPLIEALDAFEPPEVTAPAARELRARVEKLLGELEAASERRSGSDSASIDARQQP